MSFGWLRILIGVSVELLAVPAVVFGLLLLSLGVHFGARLVAGGVVAFCCARCCVGMERSRAAARKHGSARALPGGLDGLGGALPELLVVGAGWLVYHLLITMLIG